MIFFMLYSRPLCFFLPDEDPCTEVKSINCTNSIKFTYQFGKRSVFFKNAEIVLGKTFNYVLFNMLYCKIPQMLFSEFPIQISILGLSISVVYFLCSME